MARGKFNKRSGGPRLDAVNAEEIEQRNTRLAELEERRTQRRAEEDDSEDEAAGDDDKKKESSTATSSAKESNSKKAGGPPPTKAAVTTAEDHKRNMDKLAEVRRRREKAEAKRKIEEEETARQLEEEREKMAAMALRNASRNESGSSKAIPKLDKIAIKKMKPAQMKDALKERGLEIQGNAKTLQARLLKYEAERY